MTPLGSALNGTHNANRKTEHPLSRYLAIDLDSQGLFVVAGSARGGAARVEHALSWADDTSPPLALSTATAKAIGEQLRERLRAAGIAPGPVLVAIGRDRVILKEVRFPAVRPSEEAGLVRFQVLKEITEAADDVVLDYAPLSNGATDPTAERRATAVVLRKDVFAAIKTMCETAGLKLVGVTPRPFAVAAGLHRAFASGAVLPPDSLADAVAVLTTGPQGGEFTAFQAGQIVFTRSVQTPVLATEQLLVNEVRRNLTIYAGQNPGQAIRAVYVAEAEGAVGGWASRLRLGLSVPVHAFDPLAGAVPEVPAQARGRYAGAAGLLAGQAAKALPINFTAPRQPRAAADPKRKQLIFAAAAAGVLLLAAGAYGLFTLDQADQHLQNLQAQKAQLEESLALMEPNVKRLEAIDQWAAREVVWSDELFDLTDRFPRDDSIRMLSFTGTAIQPDKTGKQVAQALIDLRLGAKNPDVVTALRGAIDRDNPSDKLKYYTNTEVKIGNVAPNVAHNQLFTVLTRVNHRPPEKYTRFPSFAPPFRRTTGVVPVVTPTLPDELDGGE